MLIDTWLMSKSKSLGPGAVARPKGATTQDTFSLGYPSFAATAYATADSNPLPFSGRSSENHGPYAGLSVPTASVPAVRVGSAPGEQSAEPPGAGDAEPEPEAGSWAAQPVTAASRAPASRAATTDVRGRGMGGAPGRRGGPVGW